jgi:hypothetical protein
MHNLVMSNTALATQVQNNIGMKSQNVDSL